MWEQTCDVECAHCGEENECVCVAFNEDEFGPEGGTSLLMEQSCEHCDKSFFFFASIRFEVEADEIFKTKPKKRKDQP